MQFFNDLVTPLPAKAFAREIPTTKSERAKKKQNSQAEREPRDFLPGGASAETRTRDRLWLLNSDWHPFTATSGIADFKVLSPPG
jgi:hypothetical protein